MSSRVDRAFAGPTEYLGLILNMVAIHSDDHSWCPLL